MTGPGKWLAVIVLWLLAGGGLAYVLAGIGGDLVFVVLTAAIIRCILVYRRGVHAHVVSVLASAVRQMLPLPETLFLEAGACRGLRRLILRRTVEGLLAGMRLHEALRYAWPYCPGGTLAVLEAGEEMNQLPQALDALEADLEQSRQDQFRFRSGHPFYPIIVLTVTLSLTTLFAWKIAPMYKDIFGGMNATLPWVTRVVMDAFSRFHVVFPLLDILLLLAGGAYVYCLFRPRRPRDPRFLSRAGDWIKWRLPVWRWFERSASLVQTVEAIRLALRAGATVDRAVASAADMDTNLSYRRRLRRWLDRIRGGEDPAAAARRCRVGGGLAWAMDSRLNPGGSLDILEALERLYRSHYSYSVALIRTVFWPCVTIGIGLLVAVLALAIVGPMAAIIQQTEATMVP